MWQKRRNGIGKSEAGGGPPRAADLAGRRKGQEERLAGGPDDQWEAGHSVYSVCRMEWLVLVTYSTSKWKACHGAGRDPQIFDVIVKHFHAP